MPGLEPGTIQLKTQHTTTEPQSPVESHRSNRPKSRTEFFGFVEKNALTCNVVKKHLCLLTINFEKIILEGLNFLNFKFLNCG